MKRHVLFGILLLWFTPKVENSHPGELDLTSLGDNIHINCNSDRIVVHLGLKDDFHGMIYPKGLSKNSSCFKEYEHAGNKIVYEVPLRSCNTMSQDTDDGVEYFNTVVIQPHHKLVTNHGRGFQVRCFYETKTKSIDSEETASKVPAKLSKLEEEPLPNCHMKLFLGRKLDDNILAENVRVGDYLTLMIKLDEQEKYGIMVTNCIVHDGLNWEVQPLINNNGCPIDQDIMGSFEYSKNITTAAIMFPAHRFPFVGSVYYKCTVKLCLKETGGCVETPPICDELGENIRRRRRKRQADYSESGSLDDLKLRDEDRKDRSVEVYSSLYVNAVEEDDDEFDAPSSLSTRPPADEFCVSTRKFAIGIAIAGILLTLAVIMLVCCIVYRRRRRKGSSTTGSSLYSGPYSNQAYSRD